MGAYYAMLRRLTKDRTMLLKLTMGPTLFLMGFMAPAYGQYPPPQGAYHASPPLRAPAYGQYLPSASWQTRPSLPPVTYLPPPQAPNKPSHPHVR